jgi:hypothetical protein
MNAAMRGYQDFYQGPTTQRKAAGHALIDYWYYGVRPDAMNSISRKSSTR